MQEEFNRISGAPLPTSFPAGGEFFSDFHIGVSQISLGRSPDSLTVSLRQGESAIHNLYFILNYDPESFAEQSFS